MYESLIDFLPWPTDRDPYPVPRGTVGVIARTVGDRILRARNADATIARDEHRLRCLGYPIVIRRTV